MVKRVNQAILTAESRTHHYCGFIANILGLALRRCIQEQGTIRSEQDEIMPFNIWVAFLCRSGQVILH